MDHEEQLLVGLAAIAVLGVGAQWLAWRLRLPSILLLLAVGFIAGPLTGFIDPDVLFGELLFPLVSLSVGLILFEGGLSLRARDLRAMGASVWSLVTVGALITWAMATWGAERILGLQPGTALLLGAILVVTGPTVVWPLLRHVRPVGTVARVAHWEGIVIDPIGAALAVLVYEALPSASTAGFDEAIREMGVNMLYTIGVGALIGGLGALITVLILRRFWVPDFLQSPVLLMLVAGAFTASNLLQAESGLFTVTLMGVFLANQRSVPVKHIVEFKENLRVLLIASLFILLAARVEPGDFRALGWAGPAFVLFLILVVRPVAVFVSTIGSSLSRNERVFLAWLAPRGIVAASVASVFALRLGESGQGLVPATFMVIVGTVTVYGLTAAPLARRLGLSNPNPQGVVFASAHPGARAIAAGVKAAGFPVLVIDNNRGNINAARMEGLPTAYTSILSEHALDEAEEGGLGRLLAMTADDDVNVLATLHFRELFGRAGVYQLVPHGEGNPRVAGAPSHLRGRNLFAEGATYDALDHRFAEGQVVKATKLSQEFDYKAFRERYGEDALVLFVVTESGNLTVCTADKAPSPKPGQTLICLVDPRLAVSTESAGEDDEDPARDEKTGEGREEAA
jgi:NhaP-type Na+/H+ or K+/H+ antiporter